MREPISVAMATYNGSRFLLPQLLSIISQLEPDDELIVSDDGSTDDTIEILEGMGDNRIRILKQVVRMGPIVNFSKALAATRHPRIFLSDQDDIWLPNRITSGLKDLERFWLSFCNCKIIDAEGNDLPMDFFSLRLVRPGFYRNLWRNGYHGCCLAVRRELLDIALPFPMELPMHDWWLGLLAEKLRVAVHEPKPFVQYRRHFDNVSFALNQSNFSVKKQLQQRFYMWKNVNKRVEQFRKNGNASATTHGLKL